MAISFLRDNPNDEITDASWVKRSFNLAQADIDKDDRFWATYSTSIQKVTDTTLGGNIVINPLPQFCHYADPCLNTHNTGHNPTNAGRLSTIHGLENDIGMGHAYSEMFDDTQQIIYMQFGHIRFKGLLSFFLGMYDGRAGLLARQGRTNFSYWIGKTATTLVTLPLQIYVLAGKAISFALNRPTTQFAHLSPSMGAYWNRVTYIMNTITAYSGMDTPSFDSVTSTNVKLKDGSTMDYTDITEDGDSYNPDLKSYMHRMTKGVWREDGGIDMYLVANKAQRLTNYQQDKYRKIAESATDANDYKNKLMTMLIAEKVNPKDVPGVSLNDYLAKFHSSVFGNMTYRENTSAGDAISEDISTFNVPSTQAPAETNETTESEDNNDPQLDSSNANQQGFMTKFIRLASGEWEALKGWSTEGANYLEADFKGGSQFISFRVDHTGSVNYSFSNSTREAEIASKVNGMSKGFASKIYSFAGGNTGIGILDAATKGVTDFIKGSLDAVHLSGLYALMGASYVDIPHHWDDSVANFPSLSYSFDCVPASGNDLARTLCMYAPLACILAGSLPTSTGGATYANPMYCMLYDPGKVISRLAIFDSLSLEWGTGSQGWNNENKALSCRISFTVKDLSSVLHAPIESGFNPLKPWEGVIADDSKFNDFMGMISSLPMGDMLYPNRKLKLNLTRKALDYDSYFSRSHWSNAIGNARPVQLLSALFGYSSANVRAN